MSKLSNLSYAQKKHLIAMVRAKQTQSKWNAYYSRVRFTAASLVAGQYLLPAGGYVTAFSYGIGSPMNSAGLAGVNATASDTNILTPSQTISGEIVLVQGISLMYLAQTDANFLKQLDQSVSVKIKTNGTTEYKMGIPSMLPACGGLFGSSEAWSVAPSLPDQLSRSVGAITNGIPHSSNFYPLPEPMVWASSGQGDSAFNVELKVEQPVATIAQFSSVARVAGAGVAPYTPPTAAQVWADIMVVLIGCTVNPLSSY